MSIILFIFLFSAMGIPPMLGFFSKLFILLNVIELKMYFFAIFLIILNSIGVIYYLRFIKVMYFSTSNKFLFLTNITYIKSLFLIFLAYLNIFFFFYPNYILLLIHNLILFLFS
jgi:NADH:ubiquinone oxidoreductase subunit 2 (subunit N)